eukprot:352817-Chlamydomonas_euryale.AAC.6
MSIERKGRRTTWLAAGADNAPARLPVARRPRGSARVTRQPHVWRAWAGRSRSDATTRLQAPSSDQPDAALCGFRPFNPTSQWYRWEWLERGPEVGTVGASGHTCHTGRPCRNWLPVQRRTLDADTQAAPPRPLAFAAPRFDTRRLQAQRAQAYPGVAPQTIIGLTRTVTVAPAVRTPSFTPEVYGGHMASPAVAAPVEPGPGPPAGDASAPVKAVPEEWKAERAAKANEWFLKAREASLR